MSKTKKKTLIFSVSIVIFELNRSGTDSKIFTKNIVKKY